MLGRRTCGWNNDALHVRGGGQWRSALQQECSRAATHSFHVLKRTEKQHVLFLGLRLEPTNRPEGAFTHRILSKHLHIHCHCCLGCGMSRCLHLENAFGRCTQTNSIKLCRAQAEHPVIVQPTSKGLKSTLAQGRSHSRPRREAALKACPPTQPGRC